MDEGSAFSDGKGFPLSPEALGLPPTLPMPAPEKKIRGRPFQKGNQTGKGWGRPRTRVRPFEEGIHDARWYTGELEYKLRPHGQLAAYKWIMKWMEEHPGDAGPLLLNCHRRFGKTFLAYLIGAQVATTRPRNRVRLYSPSKTQGFDISDDVWPDLIDDKPRDIEWAPCNGDIRVLPWHNKKKAPTVEDRISLSSMIIHHGTEVRNARASRGVGANIIILDEGQEMMDMEKVMQRVIGWQTLKKKGILVLILFTPPHVRHPLNETYIPEAIRDGRYFEMPITKDEDFTEEDIQMVEKLVGSRNSLAFQVEGECRWQLFDVGNTVFPEWNHYSNRCHAQEVPFDLVYSNPDDYKPPEYYFPIVSVDWGCLHFTSVLYSYWDYEKKLWVIMDELWIRGKTTPEIIAAINGGIEKHFSKAPHPVTLIGDLASSQQQLDLRTIWKFPIKRAVKHDKDIAIASVNALISQGFIRINERCRALLSQLSFGCYHKDTNRYVADLSRKDNNLSGDLDALDSLIYGWQQVRSNRSVDPRPESGQFIGHEWIPDTLDEDDVEGPRYARVLEEHEYRL